MAYNEQLADRIREALKDVANVEEKKMFRGVTFMVNGKMCVSVSGDEMMCRIDPAIHDEVMEKYNCREMVRGGKAMKGFVYLDEEAIKKKTDFDYFTSLCLEFNPKAKASKKKK